ncbi:hypothetical protein Q6350_10195 [Isoptericola sp. b515]|uniref:hypothetical protein n=1 Tax=Isoptericola sp. b515 TaxID=3064652 RepID=UPI002712CADE|nr:hypothetical protein [Isoptericola sp. b515]MDO8148801.1 hypothetical protein [Isoptericola sp. b515]
MKRRFLRRTAAAGALGLAALGAAPAVAADTALPQHEVQHTGTVVELLQTLVDDGAITAAERDAIAADVERADEGEEDDERLLDLPTAAAVIGIAPAALRTALSADGATLASVAAARGVPLPTLEAGLVAAASHRLETAVDQGLLSPEEADRCRAELAAVVADVVQAQYPDLRGGRSTPRAA